jgi:hypothetical protein
MWEGLVGAVTLVVVCVVIVCTGLVEAAAAAEADRI